VGTASWITISETSLQRVPYFRKVRTPDLLEEVARIKIRIETRNSRPYEHRGADGTWEGGNPRDRVKFVSAASRFIAERVIRLRRQATKGVRGLEEAEFLPKEDRGANARTRNRLCAGSSIFEIKKKQHRLTRSRPERKPHTVPGKMGGSDSKLWPGALVSTAGTIFSSLRERCLPMGAPCPAGQ